jgi:hypothetical protein
MPSDKSAEENQNLLAIFTKPQIQLSSTSSLAFTSMNKLDQSDKLKSHCIVDKNKEYVLSAIELAR